MHILIIEDDERTSAYLKKGFTENGFTVDITHDGQDGLFQATTIHYDIIILDNMLPKLDGWHVITAIRKQGFEMPVLMLTARDAIYDRVKGLQLGADDYLIKPFAFSELLARVRTLLRRGQVRQVDRYKAFDLEVDLNRHKVMRGGKTIHLTSKEFNLLLLFLRRKGELLSRTFIAEQVWDMNFDSDTNIVDVAVRRLRQKIDDNHDVKLLRTIRGVGYVLEE
jgi:two-component system, OmpR family, copper resistance phosphate regulon response regulator CusR